MLCFDLVCRCKGAEIFWQAQPDVEYAVHWADRPGVTPGANGVVTVAVGTASSAWIPNPPSGKRYAIVTARLASGYKLDGLPSAEVSWPLLHVFRFVVMASRDMLTWFPADAIVSVGSGNVIEVAVPKTTPLFIHLKNQ